MLRVLVSGLCIFGMASEAWGQVTKLKIRPQSEPVPALKYRLLPEVRDLGCGNAALHSTWMACEVVQRRYRSSR